MTTGAGRTIVAVLTIAVGLAMAFGIRTIGSPAEAREARIDERRVEMLNRVSYAIDLHYSRENRLPSELAAVTAASPVEINDPVTGTPFAYRIVEDRKYELCATFYRRTRSEEPTSFWWHDSGRQCYGLAVRDVSR